MDIFHSTFSVNSYYFPTVFPHKHSTQSPTMRFAHQPTALLFNNGNPIAADALLMHNNNRLESTSSNATATAASENGNTPHTRSAPPHQRPAALLNTFVIGDYAAAQHHISLTEAVSDSSAVSESVCIDTNGGGAVSFTKTLHQHAATGVDGGEEGGISQPTRTTRANGNECALLQYGVDDDANSWQVSGAVSAITFADFM